MEPLDAVTGAFAAPGATVEIVGFDPHSAERRGRLSGHLGTH